MSEEITQIHGIRDDFLQIIGQADRRKAADMRQLKTAYENRLTQLQKSAKIEITRLVSYAQTALARNLEPKTQYVDAVEADGQLFIPYT